MFFFYVKENYEINEVFIEDIKNFILKKKM